MLTAKKGVLLSNGVFLQDGDLIKIIHFDGEIIEGRIEYFHHNYAGVCIESDIDYWDINFSNEHIKDIQLAQ